jgi:hypothetical protein
MFKFRSSTNYESIPLPGSAARLFDVKKAIVRAKKLDKSGSGAGFDFDLSVLNAVTGEEYADNTALIPRGTRIIVQRLAASRGNGLLARMARDDPGTSNQGSASGYRNNTSSTFFNISREDDEEFVNMPQQTINNDDEEEEEEENELAALRAVTDQGSALRGGPIIASAGGPRGGPGGGGNNFQPGGRNKPGGGPHHQQLSADPELREKELKQQGNKQVRSFFYCAPVSVG